MSQWPSGRSAVGVCYSENPSLFYCQLSSRADDLDQLMNDLAVEAESFPPLDKASVGSICCGQFTEDDGWYRAKVTAIDGAHMTVQYIDYGNSEQLPSSRLRCIPEKFGQPAAHALACGMAGIASTTTNGEWSNDCVERFRALTPIDMEFSADVVQCSGDTPALVHLISSVGNGNIGEQLVKENLARKVPISPMAPSLPTEKLDLAITYSTSPSEFWYQTGDTGRLDELIDYLGNLYGNESGRPSKLSSPAIGDWCCIQSPEDELWYRAVVIHLTPLSVRLLDYGNLFRPAAAFELSQDAVKLPPQARQGCMYGVRSTATTWTPAACDEFSALCDYGSESFSAVLHGGVYLDLTTSSGRSVKDLLVQQCHARVEQDTTRMASLSPMLPATVPLTSLAVGSNWHDVMCSHVQSTGCFYVQLCENHLALKSLTAKLQSAASVEPAPSRPPPPGSVCLAQFEQAWYRGQVLSVEGDRCHVFFLDFGNSEFLSMSSLRPAQQWACAEPRHAILCSFGDAVPDGAATTSALQSYAVKGMVLVGQVIAYDSRGKHVVELVDTVSQPHQDILVSDAVKVVASSGRQPTEASQAVSAGSNGTSRRYSYPDCEPGRVFSASVMHCVSPSEIYVAPDDVQGTLDGLMAKLDQCGPTLQPLATRAQATPCCAVFSEDNAFYRAQLLSCDRDGLMTVQFVDFGNSEVRSPDLVFALPNQFLETPLCAICCSLDGIQQQQDWSPDTCDELSAMLLNQAVNVNIISGRYSPSSRPAVKVIMDGSDVSTVLCKGQLASGQSSSMPQKSTQTYASAALPKPTQAAALASPVRQLPSVKIPSKSCQGFLVHAVSPDEFYVQLNEFSEQLDRVSEELGKQQRVPVTAPWQVGDLCLATYEDGDIYRARINAIFGDECSVFFVDFGNSSRCALSTLGQIPDSLCRIPSQAILCSLAGIVPYSGTSWPENVCKALAGIAGDQMLITFCQCVDHVWSTNVQDVKARDLGSFLIAKNWARVAEEAAPPVATSSTNGKEPSAQLQPLTLQPGFKGAVSVPHFINPSEFCCLVQKHEDELKNVMDELASLYNSPSAPPSLVNTEPGMACAAQFSADDQWYRAVIKSVTAEGIGIVYADYGNEEVVKSVRALPQRLARLPTQAVRCSLFGAVSPSAGWNEAVCDRLAEIVDDVVFQMEVKSVNAGQLVVLLHNAQGQSLSDFVTGTTQTSTANGNGSAPVAVQPSSDALPSSQTSLYEPGFRDTATLSTFLYPQCFFVQMSSVAADLAKIMDTLANSETEFLQKAETGIWCAACASDGAWYRGQITESKGTLATVEFIDYGFSEEVELANLSELPKGLCTDREALAVCCRLFGVSEDTELSADGYAAAEGLCEKPVQVLVRSSLADGTLEVDVLVGSRPMADIIGVTVSPVGPVTLQLGTFGSRSCKVTVNHCSSPVDFWCQMCDDDKQALFTSIQADLARCCASSTPVSRASVGDACAVHSHHDNCWYRARIVTVLNDGSASVQLVDLGSSATFAKADIYPLPPQLAQAPSLAVKCVLFGYERCVGASFDEKTVAALSNLVKGKQLYATLQTTCLVNDVATPIVQLLDVNKVIVADILKASTSPVLPSRAPSIPALRLPSPGSKINVFISFVHSSFSFWCQPAETADDLIALQAGLEEAYVDENTARHPETLSVGLCVAAVYEDDGAMYRGEVQRVTPRTADIFFLDYGDTKTLKKSDIFTLLPRFNTLPRQAMLCTINTGGATVSESAKSQLEELCDQKEGQLLVVSNDTHRTVCADVVVDGQNLATALQSLGAVQLPTLAENTTCEPTLAAGPPDLADPTANLKSGEVKVVRTVEVISPDEIYVQYADSKTDVALADLLMAMNDFYRTGGIAAVAETITEGAFFACMFSEDSSWYRVSILELDGENAEISFVDYGNKEWCALSDVRQLDGRFCSLPQQSFCIALPVECTAEQWSPEANIVISPADVDTLSAVIVSSVDGYVVANLINTDANVDLAQSLVHSGHAVYQADQEPAVVAEPVKLAEPQASNAGCPPPVRFDDGFSNLSVYVSHVVSPYEFWCQHVEYGDELDDLQQKIVGYVAEIGVFGLESPAVGSYCLALFDEDWYRARVEEVCEENSLRLLFIDYGNQLTGVNAASLLPLPAQFCTIPWYSFRCSLYTVEPVTGQTWPDAANVACQEIMLEQLLEISLNGLEKDSHVSVTHLVDAADVHGGRVNMKLVAAGVAISTTSNASTSPLPAAACPVVGTATQIIVSFISSPYEIWCQSHMDTDDFDTLSQEMANCYGSEVCSIPQLSADEICPGYSCVAQYSADECWYRARILSIDASSSTVEVRFVDFGNKDNVSVSFLRRMKSEFRSLPQQAFHLSLQGIRPVDGDEWSGDVEGVLTELTAEVCDAVISTVSKQADGESLFNGQLRGANGQDVATALCQAGLAVRIKPADAASASQTSVSPSPASPLESRTLSTPPLPSQSPVEADAAGHVNGTEESNGDRMTALAPGSATISLPSSARIGDEVRSQSSWSVAATTASEVGDTFAGDLIAVGQTVLVAVTHYETPSSFWCQVTDNASKLENLMEILNTPGLVSTRLESLVVGSSCCARYTEDERLYRGRVDSVSDGSVCVRFSDYGNTQDCLPKDVFELPKSCHMPPFQAIHCELAYAMPSGDEWCDEAIRYCEETLGNGADATLVTGVTQLSVDLHVDGKNLLDLLVSRSYAVRSTTASSASTLVAGLTGSDSVDLPDSAPVPLVEETTTTVVLACSPMSVDASPFTPTGRLPSGSRLLTPISPDVAGAVTPSTSLQQTQSVADVAAATSLPPSPSPSPHPTRAAACVPVQVPLLPDDINKDAIQLTAGMETDTSVVLVSSPSRVWCQAAADADNCELLTEKLTSLCAESVPVTSHNVDDVYAVFYNKYDAWYRARILAVNEESCLMFFIDYGNVDDIPFECIAAMPEEIASKGLCAQAMQCCLSGYTDHPCSAEDCEQLSTYFADMGILSMRVVRDAENGCPPAVEFYSGDKNIVEELFAKLHA